MSTNAATVITFVLLIGVLLFALIAFWLTIYSDERKRLTQSVTAVAKYRDPLILAADDLQSRLFNIVDYSVLDYFDAPQPQKDILVVYTCFLVGQYLAWTQILRRQTQFLGFSTSTDNKKLNEVLASITKIFAAASYYKPNQPFLLWRGQQIGIGEVMTVKDAQGELFCMGYAAFKEKWSDRQFRDWFSPVETGFETLVQGRKERSSFANQRLRHLQHLLLDLMAVLDPKRLRAGGLDSKPCGKSQRCQCSKCKPSRDAQMRQRKKKEDEVRSLTK